SIGIVVILLLPLKPTLVILPFVGLVLNGVTTVIYGSVPNYTAPERQTHLLSVFYTISIGSAAVSPPAAGFLSPVIGLATDIIAITIAIIFVPMLPHAQIRFAFLLKDPRRSASV